jgi:hypothetical protein
MGDPKILNHENKEAVAYARDALKPGESIKDYVNISVQRIDMVISRCDNRFPYWREMRKNVLRNGGMIV